MKCYLMQKPKRKSKLSAEDKKKLQGVVNNYLTLSTIVGVEKASKLFKKRSEQQCPIN